MNFQCLFVDGEPRKGILRGFGFEPGLMSCTSKNSVSHYPSASRDQLLNSNQSAPVCGVLNLKYTC